LSINQHTGHIYCAFEVISPVTRHNIRGVVHKFQITPSGPLRRGGCKWGNLPGPPDQGGGGGGPKGVILKNYLEHVLYK
jgi:hypothetical protein